MAFIEELLSQEELINLQYQSGSVCESRTHKAVQAHALFRGLYGESTVRFRR
jgi:hypothetical protein